MVPYESKATRTIWASLIQWLSSLAVSWQVSIEQVPSSASRPADLVAAAPGKPPASHFWWSLADCLSQEFFSHAGLSSSSMLFCQILFLCSCLCWHLQSCIRRNFSGHGAFWSLLYIILDSGNSSFFVCVWGVRQIKNRLRLRGSTRRWLPLCWLPLWKHRHDGWSKWFPSPLTA